MDARVIRRARRAGWLALGAGMLMLVTCVPVALLGAVASIGTLSDAPPSGSGGPRLSAALSFVLAPNLCGLTPGLVGSALLVAAEKRWRGALGLVLRISLVVSLLWAGLIGLTSGLVWGQGGLGQLLLFPAAAGLGYAWVLWKLYREVPRKSRAREVEGPAEAKNEWHAGPVR